MSKLVQLGRPELETVVKDRTWTAFTCQCLRGAPEGNCGGDGRLAGLLF